MTKEHSHNWIYNKAEEIIINNSLEWRVVRFCPICRKVEIIQLEK